MRLIVAEKPNQARSIASALGIRGKYLDGSIKGKDITITWCIGHLVTLALPQDYDPKYKTWKLEDLPIMPKTTILKPIAKTMTQWKTVKALLNSKKFKDIVNATDPGREGELIFDNVYRLSGSTTPVLRLWTPSLTREAIATAFKNLRPSSNYKGLQDAARCRSEADWIIGLNATRIATLNAQSKGKRDGPYTVGRVQTPILAAIVKREAQITNFKSKHYWTLKAEFQTESGQTYHAAWSDDGNTHLNTQKEAKALIQKLKASKSATIAEFTEKLESRPPPELYDLTTLQREANIKHRYSAQKTLNICQSLYEKHKILSYPRTNSRHLTQYDANELSANIQRLTYLPQLIKQKTKDAVPDRYISDKKVVDHHALIPTGKSPGKLTTDEKRIFDMVFFRTLSAFYEDKVELSTKIETTILGETFLSTSKEILIPGWSILEDPASKQKKPSLPKLAKGEGVIKLSTTILKNTTNPPPRFSEADLLKLMQGQKTNSFDDNETKSKPGPLGTPATRASIIEALKSRNLIEIKGRFLHPTPKGIYLISCIPNSPLRSTTLTSEWEEKLLLMAGGEYPREAFMTEIREFAKSILGT